MVALLQPQAKEEVVLIEVRKAEDLASLLDIL